MTNKKEYQKRYYEKHKQQISEYNKKWYEKNKEKMQQWKKQYYLDNKEKYDKLHKEWIEKNKDRNRELINKCRRKRAEKLRSQGCINPWGVISKGKEPKYKEKTLTDDILDLMDSDKE